MMNDQCVERQVKDYSNWTQERHKYHEWMLISEKEDFEYDNRLQKHFRTGKRQLTWYCKWCRKIMEEKI